MNELTLDQALQQAVEAHKSGKLQDAERLYRAILQTQPKHPDANHNLGLLAVSENRSEAALPLFRTALEASPSQGQFWISYIDALIKEKKFDDAKQVLHQAKMMGLAGEKIDKLEAQLIKSKLIVEINKPEKNNLFLAIELREAGKYQEAQDWLNEFVANESSDAEAWSLLSQVYLLDKKDAEAENALSQAILIDSELPSVLRNQARLLLKKARPAEALQMAKSGYDRSENDPESWIVLAACLGVNQKDQEARALIERALVARPIYAEALANRALIRLRAKDIVGAINDAEMTVSIKPHLAQIWGLLGSLRYQTKNLSGAIEALKKALEFESTNVSYMVDLGEFLRQEKKVTEAIGILKTATKLAPQNGKAWANLGTAFQENQDIDSAKEAYKKALAINPQSAEISNNLGAISQSNGDWKAAVQYFEQAIKIKPDFAEAHFNLGVIFMLLARPQDAAASYRQAIALKPDYAYAYCNLGVTLIFMGLFSEAEESFRQATVLKPDYVEAHINLGNALKDLGRLAEAEASHRQAITLKPSYTEAHSNLLLTMNYAERVSVEASLEEALRFGANVSGKANCKYTSWRCSQAPDKLKVGFVSGDLRNHPVGYFLEGLLSNTNQSQYELIAYTATATEDELTKRIKPYFRLWQPIFGRSDGATAKMIHDDGIHILIDLAGHTANNRLPVFAYKPAPIQVTWLGYFATTGVDAIDYLLGDPFVTPIDEEHHFLERIWRLPETYLCFTPPTLEIQIGSLPALANGYITFGCFNILPKLNAAVLALWAAVLHAVKDSKLFLKTKQFADSQAVEMTIARFAAFDVEPHRLIIEGPSSRSDYFVSYNRVDIALDPFPFPGGTTSVEGLWMGVPVITKKGDRLIAHNGETIAHNSGQSEWVAQDDDDYIRKAKHFSADLNALAKIRAELRAQVLASPLCDSKRFAGNFENAMTQMWAKYSANFSQT